MRALRKRDNNPVALFQKWAVSVAVNILRVFVASREAPLPRCMMRTKVSLLLRKLFWKGDFTSVPYHFWLLKLSCLLVFLVASQVTYYLVAWLIFNLSILLKMLGSPKGFDYNIAIIIIRSNQIRPILLLCALRLGGGQCRIDPRDEQWIPLLES